MQHYMRDHAIPTVWPTAERLLVCVSESPLAARLVRSTRRMATALRAEWLVAYVETPRHARLSDDERDRVIHTLRLAEQLGAETISLTGQSVSETILDVARRRNVSKIVVGKPVKPRWRELLFGSVVDDVVRHSGEIDVYVISGEHDDTASQPPHLPRPSSPGANYGAGIAVMVLCTLVAWLMLPYFELANLVMVYLLGVVFTAWRFGRGPSSLAAVLGVAAFDFFFVPPYLTFAVSDTQYLVTFAVMLLVALLISTLTIRIQQQAEAARGRERRTAALYAMSRDFAGTRGLDNLLEAAVRHIGEIFDSRVAVLVPDDHRALSTAVGDAALVDDTNERGVAHWVFEHGEAAGLGTTTLPGGQALYLPLRTDTRTLGVLCIQPQVARQLLEPEQFHLLETFATQTALAIERAQLSDEAQQARVAMETEHVRNTLLSSVSHRLQAPLAVITGATSALLDGAALDEAPRQELAQAAYDEAERLNRLVQNLLDLTWLEAGTVDLRRERQPLADVVGAAVTRLGHAMAGRPVALRLPDDLPLVPIDSPLIERVLINVLDNTAAFTPPGNPIDIEAQVSGGEVIVDIADRGPGLAPGDEQRIFETFYRGQIPAAPAARDWDCRSAAVSSKPTAAGCGPRTGRAAARAFGSACRWRSQVSTRSADTRSAGGAPSLPPRSRPMCNLAPATPPPGRTLSRSVRRTETYAVSDHASAPYPLPPTTGRPAMATVSGGRTRRGISAAYRCRYQSRSRATASTASPSGNAPPGAAAQ